MRPTSSGVPALKRPTPHLKNISISTITVTACNTNSRGGVNTRLLLVLSRVFRQTDRETHDLSRGRPKEIGEGGEGGDV